MQETIRRFPILIWEDSANIYPLSESGIEFLNSEYPNLHQDSISIDIFRI